MVVPSHQPPMTSLPEPDDQLPFFVLFVLAEALGRLSGRRGYVPGSTPLENARGTQLRPGRPVSHPPEVRSAVPDAADADVAPPAPT